MDTVKRLAVLGLVVGLMFVVAGNTAYAATKTWDGGGGDGLWTTAANWNDNTLPGSSDDVVLDNTSVSGNYVVTLDGASTRTVRSVQAGYSGNSNTITLIVSGATTNLLTVNGGGATALHIMDGGVISNQSTSGTRGILLSTSSDVFKMSGTGSYIHVTTTSGSAIPERTSGTTSANYDFAVTSVFENQAGTASSFDANPTYGNYVYNVTGSANSANKSLTINGTLTISQGTFGVCAGTSSTFTIGGNVSISSGATFRGTSGTGTATVNISGDVSGAGTFQGSETGGSTTNITIGGSITSLIAFNNATTNVAFSGGTSSVNFTPANSSSPTVQNITVASGKAVTLGAKITIASGKTLTIDSGGIFATGAEFVNSGAVTVNGSFQINQNGWTSGNSFTYGANGTLVFNNSSGSYGVNADAFWPTTNGPVNVTVQGAGGITMNVARTVSGTFQTAAAVTNGNNLTLSGTVQINAGGSFGSAPTYSGSATLVYNTGSGGYNVYYEWTAGTSIGSGVPKNVTIQTGSGTINMPNTARTVPGDLTITTGTLTLSGTFGADLNVGGNFSNSGTFNTNNRAVTFNGSTVQSLTGATTFDYLTLNNSSGLTLNNNVTVNQTLTLTSGKIDTGSSAFALDCSGSISGAASTRYILGNLKKTYCATGSFTYPTGTSNGYSPVAATLTALATNPSSLQIKAVESNAPGFTDSKSLDRYWTLTKTGDLTTNLTFTYLAGDVDGTESDYRIFRSTTQVCDATCVDESTHTATISGVTQFSNWTMGEANAPTSAILISFKAKLTPKKQVKLSWETGSEMTLLGFDVYRQTVGAKKWVKVNANVIQAQNPGGVTGAKYVYTDKTVQSGKTYRYKLKVLNTDGTFEWSETRKVTVP